MLSTGQINKGNKYALMVAMCHDMLNEDLWSRNIYSILALDVHGTYLIALKLWEDSSTSLSNRQYQLLVGKQIDAKHFYVIRLFQSSTCFEQTRAHQQEVNCINPYPTAFPYGNGMVLHFYQQQESSTTKTVHKVINKGLKTYI